MTKVYLSKDILEYRKDMAETLRGVIQHQFIGGVQVRSRAEPPLAQPDLLPPPSIELVDLAIYDGRVEDVILITTSNDFGIESLQIMIRDDKGNLIESGAAMNGNDGFGTWCYFAEVPVPSGTSVTVQVIAMDCLGGVGALCAGKTTIG